MEQEGLSHLLQFVIAADNFEHLLISQSDYDGLLAQDDAMVLYDKYVVMTTYIFAILTLFAMYSRVIDIVIRSRKPDWLMSWFGSSTSLIHPQQDTYT